MNLLEEFKSCSEVSIDTRKMQPESMFFCLKGENFDGNKFAEKALENGARYVIIDNPEFNISDKTILVNNSLQALQDLANNYRKEFEIPFIGITGSNGKTTTKELIAAVLEQKYKVHYTKGNFNNHIGVPLTLLAMPEDTEIAVIEMGANHIGEISMLSRISDPDYGLITNIGKAHLEGFGGYQGVIKAKTELYKHIKKQGEGLFVNSDDDLLMQYSEGADRFYYGKDMGIELIQDSDFVSLKWNNEVLNTNLVGDYNYYNILAAIKIAHHFDIEDSKIKKAIENYTPKNQRSQFIKKDKNEIILDAYNANPSSMELALKNFSNSKKQNKYLLLGDMLELGDESYEEHKKIIELTESLGFKNAAFVGEEFYKHKNNKYKFFNETSDLLDYLKSNDFMSYTFLIKASRLLKLEEAVDFIE